MDYASHKNTSVFLDGALPHVGDLSHAEARRGGELLSRKERKAGGPTSVSATINRSGWKRIRLEEDAVLQTTAPMHRQNRVICNASSPMCALYSNQFFGCRIYNELTVNGAI